MTVLLLRLCLFEALLRQLLADLRFLLPGRGLGLRRPLLARREQKPLARPGLLLQFFLQRQPAAMRLEPVAEPLVTQREERFLFHRIVDRRLALVLAEFGEIALKPSRHGVDRLVLGLAALA